MHRVLDTLSRFEDGHEPDRLRLAQVLLDFPDAGLDRLDLSGGLHLGDEDQVRGLGDDEFQIFEAQLPLVDPDHPLGFAKIHTAKGVSDHEASGILLIGMHRILQIEDDPVGSMEACVDGVRAAERDTGVRANIIGGLSRTYGVETCMRELGAILAVRDQVAAVDLAGDEAGFPAPLFKEHFHRVRDAGLHVTIHAGEVLGPESVWSAISDLGAERIGHGYRSIEDPKLVEYLAEWEIGLESCPTSNLHISAISDYASHPIKPLADRGVRFCLNTDDPGISNIDIAHEYEVAAPAVGLTPEQVRQSQRDALDMAFLSDQEKQELLKKAAGRE